MKILFSIIFSIALISSIFPQQNTVSSGGNGSNASGSISISVGQIDFLNVSSANGNMQQGVQQPETFITTSVLNSEDSFDMTIFPNPTQRSFTIDLSVKEESKMVLHVFDAAGREVLRSERYLHAGKNQEKVNAADLAMGIYFIEIDLNGKTLRAKLVKE